MLRGKVIDQINHLFENFTSIETVNRIKDDITQYKRTKHGLNYHLNIIEYDDLLLLYPDKVSHQLHFNNDIIDEIIHNVNYAVISVTNLKLIALELNIDKFTIDKLTTNNLTDVKVYNKPLGTDIIVFFNNGWKVCYNMKIVSSDDFPYLTYEELNMEYVYYLTVINARLNKILFYDTDGVIEKRITQRIITNDHIFTPLCEMKFSCLDELLFELDEISFNDQMTKRITNCGYLLEINNLLFYIENTTYANVYNTIKDYANIHVCYLDLYKTDKLNDILSFTTHYHSDIIKRINLSMKTVSKEILNIYHITRNKKHCDIYNSLTSVFKRILYELHTIYINNRTHEIINDNERLENRSLTVDDVYHYLKKLHLDTLIKTFEDREEIIVKLRDILDEVSVKGLFNVDCISTKTQTYLMKVK